MSVQGAWPARTAKPARATPPCEPGTERSVRREEGWGHLPATNWKHSFVLDPGAKAVVAPLAHLRREGQKAPKSKGAPRRAAVAVMVWWWWWWWRRRRRQ